MVYSDQRIDPTQDIATLSNAELEQYAKLRQKLRINVPGICALFFERILDIFIREVIGWDDDHHQSTKEGGVFGIPRAYIVAVEEQGRRTLHGHIQIWVNDYNFYRDAFCDEDRDTAREAKRIVCGITDKNAASCSLVGDFTSDTKRRLLTKNGIFHHDCSVELKYRQWPRVVDHQSLRDMRRQHLTSMSDILFAFVYIVQKHGAHS